MLIWTVFFSLIRALFSCFCNKELRKLCTRPWLIALLSYIPLLIGAFYAHQPIVDLLTSPSESWYGALWIGIVWCAVWVLLLIGCVILSGSVVSIVAGSYYTLIARYVLTQEGIKPPPESEGLEAIKTTTIAELQKLIVLLPLGILALFLGLIPVIGFIGLALGVFLAGYQFLDYVMDAFEIEVNHRFKFAKSHPLFISSMGIPSACLMGIPFTGLLLPPIAVVAAAKILAQRPELLRELLNDSPK